MDFNSLKVNVDTNSSIAKYEKNDSYNKTRNIKENMNNNSDNENNIDASAQDLSKIGFEISLKNEKNSNDVDNKSKKKNSYRDKLVTAIEEANKKLMGVNKKFSYEVHDKTNKIIVKIMDANTGEIVKEIPPEKELDMIAKMKELVGILVDETR